MLHVKNMKKFFKKRIKGTSWIKNMLFPQYEKFYAIKGISFDIKQGEKVAFIGPNGAGKSTTIKAILGILHYDMGEISVFDMNPKKDRQKISKLTASVFGQRSQLLYHLPLIDSFNFFKIIYDIPQEIFEKRLAKFVQRF